MIAAVVLFCFVYQDIAQAYGGDYAKTLEAILRPSTAQPAIQHPTGLMASLKSIGSFLIPEAYAEDENPHESNSSPSSPPPSSSGSSQSFSFSGPTTSSAGTTTFTPSSSGGYTISTSNNTTPTGASWSVTNHSSGTSTTFGGGYDNTGNYGNYSYTTPSYSSPSTNPILPIRR